MSDVPRTFCDQWGVIHEVRMIGSWSSPWCQDDWNTTIVYGTMQQEDRAVTCIMCLARILSVQAVIDDVRKRVVAAMNLPLKYIIGKKP